MDLLDLANSRIGAESMLAMDKNGAHTESSLHEFFIWVLWRDEMEVFMWATRFVLSQPSALPPSKKLLRSMAFTRLESSNFLARFLTSSWLYFEGVGLLHDLFDFAEKDCLLYMAVMVSV